MLKGQILLYLDQQIELGGKIQVSANENLIKLTTADEKFTFEFTRFKEKYRVNIVNNCTRISHDLNMEFKKQDYEVLLKIVQSIDFKQVRELEKTISEIILPEENEVSSTGEVSQSELQDK